MIEEAYRILRLSVSSYGGGPRYDVQASWANPMAFERTVRSLLSHNRVGGAADLLGIMHDAFGDDGDGDSRDVVVVNAGRLTVLYNTVLSAMSRRGDAARALSLLPLMRERNVSPDVVTFNVLMSACLRAGRWREALDLLDECEAEANVEPDVITYTNAMRACARGRRVRRALSLLEEVREREGVEMDAYLYTSVIDGERNLLETRHFFPPPLPGLSFVFFPTPLHRANT